MNTHWACCLLALSVAAACRGRVENDSKTGDASTANTEWTQGCESCCMPMKLSPSKIDVYRLAGLTSIELIVERAGPPQVWEPLASVTTAWGPQQCQSGRNPADAQHGLILCSIGTDAITAGCGDPIDVEVRLRSNTYASTGSAAHACADNDFGPVSTFSLPVKCASCPATTEDLDDEPCDISEGQVCPAGAKPEPPGGGTADTSTCTCRVTSDTGERVWSCN